MSQSARQRNLFAAEDFSVVYDSFKQANFQSYDYDTIRLAMVEYIRNKYPEHFNDWVKSSEFVALVELMAFLGNNLAFRADLAVRENFLSTAQKNESVLRIADFLGYSPARPYPSTGLLKIKTIKTTQNIYDVKGKSLKNKTIQYYDETNSTSYQDFLLILNEVFSSSNKFGSPYNSSVINGIETQTYQTNNTISNSVVFPFKSKVNGVQQPFEIVNLEITADKMQLVEPSPNVLRSYNIVYKNDRQGLLSPNTGFFVGFKQGTLSQTDNIISAPVANTILDIWNNNVNNIDVWVQSIDDNEIVTDEWTKVDRQFGVSALFNSVDKNIRKIFSVKTLTNNAISIVFGDGSFSEMPSGIIRTWTRSSLNQSYALNPDDIGTVTYSFNYIGSDNNQYTVTFTAELEETITTASSSESIANIKENAGRVFSTQDRMVTAADYNVYPLSATNNILKIKSINRTYSGHSRFLKINDPTSQYQNVNMFGDDGYLYYENVLGKDIATLNIQYSNFQIYDLYIKNLAENSEIMNFYYSKYSPYTITYSEDTNIFNATKFEWQLVSSGTNVSTGYITRIAEPNATTGTGNKVRRIGGVSDYVELRNITRGSIVDFYDPTTSETIGARVIDIYQDGLGLDDSTGNPTGIDNKGNGSIKLSKLIPDGYVIKRIYSAYNKKFTETEKTNIINELSNKNTFGLRYDPNSLSWKIITASNLAQLTSDSADTFSLLHAGNNTGNNADNSWIIRFDYQADSWAITYRKFRIIFGSETSLRFYNENGKQKFNMETGKPERDKIKILSVNNMPDSQSPLGVDTNLFIYGYFSEPNGYTDDHKVIVTLSDIDNDGYPDSPRSLQEIVGTNTIRLANFVEDGYTYSAYSATGTKIVDGRKSLKFQFTRIADNNQRIDPAISNIIDTYVLTNNYDTLYRTWLQNDKNIDNRPLPPTSDELSLQFYNIDTKKSISDTVIYRSVKYKTLFGNTADSGLQAKFRIVKSAGSSITDTELKSRIIANIQLFFDINNWDFGETFYFTEMAAFIHNKMAGILGSIVIVPVQESSLFGNLFQVSPNGDELFIPDVTLDNIEIVTSYTEDNLRMKK